MPNVKDLGLANDKIVNIQRTTGTGSPGQTDTYTITLRSGDTFTFNVTNGANGSGLELWKTNVPNLEDSITSLSALATALRNRGVTADKLVKIFATSNNDGWAIKDVAFTIGTSNDDSMEINSLSGTVINYDGEIEDADDWVGMVDNGAYWALYIKDNEFSIDSTLSDSSNNPIKNKAIYKLLDAQYKSIKNGEYLNDNPPSGFVNTANATGFSFDKASLGGKDISKIKTRLIFNNPNFASHLPTSAEIRLYNSPQTSATQNMGGAYNLGNPIKTKEITLNALVNDVEIDFEVLNEDIGNVFIIIFFVNVHYGDEPGLMMANTKSGTNLYPNGGLYGLYGNNPNTFQVLGNQYPAWYNKYFELEYADVDFAKEEEIANCVDKEEVGYGLQPNKNIWNKNEQVDGGYANPSNGQIQDYPENISARGYMRSGYLNIKPNTNYIFSMFNNTSATGYLFVAYYNKNKQYISGGQLNGSGSKPLNGTTFITPNNASVAYAIFSVSNKNCAPFQIEEGTVATAYQEFTGDKYLMDNLVVKEEQIVKSGSTVSVINVPDTIYAVVGDKIEIFYKGILNIRDCSNYYVYCECDIGTSYGRKFTCTPVLSHVGNHTLNIYVYDSKKQFVESKSINLRVVATASSPTTRKNILCMGDSLTTGGYWVGELHRRLNLTTNKAAYTNEDAPIGLGLSNIYFIGKKQTPNGAGFEGFGGWRFSTYLNPATSTDDYWVTSTTHNKTDADQESIWQASNGTQWQLETIQENRLKFKKYNGTGVLPSSGTLTWVSGGTHTEDIVYAGAELAEGNPFSYNGAINFEAYCEDLGITTIDEVYILLGWNNYATDKAVYKAEAKQFIDLLRAFNPNIKVVLMGLEIPSIDGLAHNYGASGTLTYLKQQQFVFDLNDLYKEIASEYVSGVSFVNIASQFDTDYCMPTITTTPNTRIFTEIQQQSNGVHPAIPGYYQIADIMYRWTNAKINS